MSLPAIHRVVTGHDARGSAIISSDGPLATVIPFAAIPGTVFHEVWNTTGTPAVIDNSADPTLGPLKLSPPVSGTRIRFVDIPPDTRDFLQHGTARMREGFASIGDEHASTATGSSPHPLMHRTQSIDYGIVIEGEIVLILDDSEVTVRQGNVVIQRGTNHGWANRTDKMCRMLFILIDGRFEPALDAAIKQRG